MQKNKFALPLILLLLVSSFNPAYAWLDEDASITDIVKETVFASFGGIWYYVYEGGVYVYDLLIPDEIAIPTQSDTTEDASEKLGGADANATDVDDVAEADIKHLIDEIDADMVHYSMDGEGSTADIDVKLYGPDNIRGYSVFPVKVTVYRNSFDGLPNGIHITKVVLTVKQVGGDDDGNSWWTYTKEIPYWYDDEETGNYVLNGVYINDDTATFNTILKTPDPWASQVEDYATGTIITPDIEDIISSDSPSFEIECSVYGELENWFMATTYDDYGNPVGEHKERDNDLGVVCHYTTSKTYQAEKAGLYALGDFEGALTKDFEAENGDEYKAFEMIAQGSTSDIITRFWATPIHVLNSHPAERLYVLANPSYMEEFKSNIQISDDARLVTVRILKDGTYEISNDKKEAFGDLSDVNIVTALTGYEANEDTIGFATYGIVYAEVERDDGKDLPIWSIVRPKIVVLNDDVTIVGDIINELSDLLSKDSLNVFEKESVNNQIVSLGEALTTKMGQASTYVEKGQDLDMPDVERVAKKAYDNYEKAIETLNDINYEDVEDINNKLEEARNYELSGDFYLESAEAYYFGDKTSAEIAEESGDKLGTSSSGWFIFSDGSIVSEFVEMVPGGTVTIVVVLGGLVLAYFLFKPSGRRRRY
ncbi:hypothetical protein HNP88_000381 [Methanococcus maripaludis]|uniref:Uncharacterized protein n=1 Tax=Methanococcus maripaludis TaxID=39152 RepID=A0A7J9NL79_METMI|nr:hypothetical protein [Methanococcus maripaludis]MBA2846197.1 hypothetical protein [Methanococcus maripaludis]